MIEAIIFDFDGVIVNSNPIKRDAYFVIFSDIKNSRNSVEEAIRENPEKTRYGIIETILKKLKKKGLMEFEDLKAERDKYVQKYGETTERETIKVEEIKGAEQALATLSQKYPLFILTSTIQKSIEKVVRKRRLDKYFEGVYGADSSDYNKPQILEKMAKENSFNPKKAVFVGDGKADYECAKRFEMIFIGIINETNNFKERGDIKYKLDNLERLQKVVMEIEKSF